MIIASVIVVAVCLACIGIVAMYHYRGYTQAATDPQDVRNMLIHQIEGTIRPAPIEAKTGATYFPALRLYIHPADDGWSVNDFTYDVSRMDESDQGMDPVVAVTRKALVDSVVLGLYNVRPEAVFDKLPHVQACARGVMLATRPLEEPEDRTLYHIQALSDGRELHMYYEQACPELRDVADDLKAVQVYGM